MRRVVCTAGKERVECPLMLFHNSEDKFSRKNFTCTNENVFKISATYILLLVNIIGDKEKQITRAFLQGVFFICFESN